MRRRITLYHYLANDEKTAMKAKKVMEDFGYKVTFSDEPGMVVCLQQFVREQREDGLKALAMIHPDRELILDTIETTRNFDGFLPVENTPKEKASTVSPTTITASPNKSDHTPIIMVGLLASALFLSVAILSKK